MSKKAKIIIATYASAAIVALGIFGYVGFTHLGEFRMATKYSSDRAYDEMVVSVKTMSDALDKSVYATDGSMCSKICSEAYANAMAAETAMSTLPLATHELEQIAAFINSVGDYTYTLCGQAASEGFTDEQVEMLTKMGALAAEFAVTLREIQAASDIGEVLMDTRELRVENVLEQPEAQKLSARLLEYEQSFQSLEKLEYDGKYGKSEQTLSGEYSEDEMLELAAEYAKLSPEELELVYEYEGEDGRRSYRAGELLVCVNNSGVRSLNQSRLVSEGRIDQQEAQSIAEEFLKTLGFEALELAESKSNGRIASMKYNRVQDDARYVDNSINVSVALDDGSIYSFNAEKYSGEESEFSWEVSEEEAAQKLPGSLKLKESSKVIIKSPGGIDTACYEFTCEDSNGRKVKIYVDAVTGMQCNIVLQ